MQFALGTLKTGLEPVSEKKITLHLNLTLKTPNKTKNTNRII